MAFGQFHGVGGRSGKPMAAMSDINVTPMVDVILVLLIIFMISAPLLNPAIKLDLPKAESQEITPQAQSVTVSFDAANILYWNEEQISFTELENKLASTAKNNLKTEILLRADKATQYDIIAKVMAAAQMQGLSQIAFVTQTPSSSK